MSRKAPNGPNLLVSNRRGEIFEIPELFMAATGHLLPLCPPESCLIELPPGSDLFLLPGRRPVGYDPHSAQFVEVDEYQGEEVFAVAAFMAPAYLHFYRTVYSPQPGAPRLPLYCYTAVGWHRDRFVVPAARIDDDPRQDLPGFDLRRIERNAAALRRRFPNNRLVHHLLDNCVDRYGCPAARNFALGRYECPVPASPGCNAACVGCISEQPAEAEIVSSHDRISFMPTPDEIVEFTVPHLEKAPRPVVSFGQGCEGEPLLAGEVIEAAIKEIRRRIRRGVININTNGSRPDVLERLCRAGLNSVRVSLNSAQKFYYNRYYRPRNYTFDDVVESLKVVRRYQGWTSINYLIFPGLTDHPEEYEALKRLIEEVELDMVQTRNLNIDPEWYIEALSLADLPSSHFGMPVWLNRLRQDYPGVQLGYFNPYREEAIR